MPHDKNGQLLEVGDLVNVPARVTAVHPTEEHCNVSLETVEPMYPTANTTGLTLNTKQVEKVAEVRGQVGVVPGELTTRANGGRKPSQRKK